MERNRRPAPDQPVLDASVERGNAAASFLDSVMDLLEETAENAASADEMEKGRAEAKLARQLREAIGARLRDAA